MSPDEVTILDLLAERDRTTAAKLDAIVARLDATSRENADVRADIRGLHDQLLGVATGAEIASLKRQVNAEVDVLAGRIDLVERRLDTREAVEANVEEQRARRAWMLPASVSVAGGLACVMLGAAIERLVS